MYEGLNKYSAIMEKDWEKQWLPLTWTVLGWKQVVNQWIQYKKPGDVINTHP